MINDLNTLIKDFQSYTGTNEVPLFNYELTRFGPKKAYWHFSFAIDDYSEVRTGAWNDDFQEKVFSSRGESINDKKLDDIRKKMIAMVEETKKQERERAKSLAQKLIPKLTYTYHPYIDKKNIKPYTSLVNENELIIPVYSNLEELAGYQIIDRNNNKSFLAGTPLKGSYHALKPFKDSAKIHLCEGFATGATIQEADESTPVVIAFNASNIPNVAQWLVLNTKAQIVICADKDSSGTGEKYAKQCLSLCQDRCSYILPQTELKDADFNDIGVDNVRKQILKNEITLIKDEEIKIDEKFEYPRFNGIAQEFFRYYYNSSRVKRTRFAMASTLSTLSTMWGNKVMFNGLATNMYCLISGSSTSGKEDPVALTDLVFTVAKYEKMVSKNLSSDSAILTELSPAAVKGKVIAKTEFPTQLHIFKEASSLFYLANDNKTPYAANMANIYQDLFTSPFKPYSGKNLKNERLGECFSPCISILGSMTDTDFENCLRPELFDKGLGGRFLFFYDKEFKKINRELSNQKVPKILAEYINSARTRDPFELQIDKSLKDELFDIFDNFREEAHYSDGPISKAKGRLPEHFSKMLMINAMSSENSSISKENIEWTKKWFETYIRELDILFSQKMHLSKMSKTQTEVELAIKATGIKGMFHSRLLVSSVCKKNSLDSKKLGDTINFLKEAEVIVSSKKKNGDSERESIIYYHQSFVKKNKN